MVKTNFSAKKIKITAVEKLISGISTRQVARYLCDEYNGFKDHKTEAIKLINGFNPLLAFETERIINKLQRKMQNTESV